MAKFREIRDFWQNFKRNLRLLTNEKWPFWRQNPLEPNKHAFKVHWQIGHLIPTKIIKIVANIYHILKL